MEEVFVNCFAYVLEIPRSNGMTETISELWLRRSGFSAAYRDLMLDLAECASSTTDKHRFMSIEFLLSRFGDRVKRAAQEGKPVAYLIKIYRCWVNEKLTSKIKHKQFMEELRMNYVMPTDPETIDSYYRVVADVLQSMIKKNPLTLSELQDSILAKYCLDNGLDQDPDNVAKLLGVKKAAFYVIRKSFLERVRTIALTKIVGVQ